MDVRGFAREAKATAPRTFAAPPTGEPLAGSPAVSSALGSGWGVGGLPPDAVLDLEHLRLAGDLDPGLHQDRNQCLAPRLHLLARVPDLADGEVLRVGPEADVVVEPLRGKAGFLDLGVALVVPLGGQVRGLEADNDAHGNPLYWL